MSLWHVLGRNLSLPYYKTNIDLISLQQFLSTKNLKCYKARIYLRFENSEFNAFGMRDRCFSFSVSSSLNYRVVYMLSLKGPERTMSWSMKIYALHSFKTSVTTCPKMQRHVTEDVNCQNTTVCSKYFSRCLQFNKLSLWTREFFCLALFCCLDTVKGKGKAFPLQAWAGPWGFSRLRLRIFSTFGTMKVVRSSPLRTGRLHP